MTLASTELAKIASCSSELFGLQYAHFLPNRTAREIICDDFDAINGRWAEAGVDVEKVEEAVCDAIENPLDPDEFIAALEDKITCIFVGHVLSSGFPGSNFTLTSCRFMDPKRLADLNILPEAHEAICNAADAPVPAMIESTEPRRENALGLRLHAASSLFATLTLLGFTEASQIVQVCEHWPSYAAGVDHIGLNGTVVHNTICENSDSLITLEDARYRIFDATTVIYGAELGYASGHPAWFEYLCSALNTEGMAAVNLDGSSLWWGVCQLWSWQRIEQQAHVVGGES